MTENKNTDDLLGYGDYADSLWQRIENAVYKDFESGKAVGDDPLVVGIFGEWGAGKSKLLELILSRAKRKLSEQKKLRRLDAGFMLTIPVFFQPWKYEHEEHLHIPLLMHIFDSLKEAIKTGQSPSDYWIQSFGELADKYKTQVPASVKLFEKLLVDSIGVGANVSMPGATKLGLKAANSLAELLPKLNKPKSNLADKFKFSGDGHYYRQIHKALKAVTRPNQADNREMLQGMRTTCNPRINFVIFIDDLDRCLPENAVAALELIKTIFNVESFAFVLALDDEIIERGIGHRYKEYKLQDKKPEMPITGFEYLEKIVHLPFRLPAITREQARTFVQQYEQSIEKDVSLRWFDDLPMQTPTGQPKKSNNPEEDMSDAPLPEFLANSPHAHTRADFLELALSGFDAFVPRKLIRLVELLHQISKIAKLKGKPINLESNASIDARIVMCMALIQLFQPELFRILRRRVDSFPFLMSAFSRVLQVGATKPDDPKFKNSKLSDIDLWQWAIDASVPGVAPAWALKDLESIFSYVSRVISDVHKGNQSDGADAQQVRLPLVAQLVEHRAVQRHVFDVLKLIEKLVASMENLATKSNVPPYKVTFEGYLTLLADMPISKFNNAIAVVKEKLAIEEINAPNELANTKSNVNRPDKYEAPVELLISAKGRILLPGIDKLASDLLSQDQTVQANLASRNDLRKGRLIEQNALANLLEEVQRHMAAVGFVRINKEKHKLAQRRLLNGLQYLAPYIDRHSFEAQGMWKMVEKCVDFSQAVDPNLRAMYYDVRAALGQDLRFKSYYAFGKRIKGDAAEAPSGFVKIEGGNFLIGSKKDKDNFLANISLKSFYISRYLVTVAQYAFFRHSEEFKEWSKNHPDEIRKDTPDWNEQLANLCRPVVNVNWFEATAYTQWLQKLLEAGDLGVKNVPAGYQLRLPNEKQWEVAARGGLVGKDYPWGDEVTDIDQRANINRVIGSACTVGSYAGNPSNAQALFDMAGNVWEWQAGAKDENYKSLRGGSWADPSMFARCSFRDRLLPEDWNNGIGFRLVLSPADL